MADRQARYHQQQEGQEGIKSILPEKGPSTSQILALVAALPLGGTLLLFAGLTLAGTLTGLAITTPVFILFSPIIVPAAFVIAMAVFGFLTSGALGITALSSLSWTANCIRQLRGVLPQQLEQAKRRAQEAAGQLGQKTKEAGQTVQSKAQEVTRGGSSPGRT